MLCTISAIECIEMEPAEQVMFDITLEMEHGMRVVAVNIHHPFLVVCQMALQRPVRVVSASTDATSHPPCTLRKVSLTKPSVVGHITQCREKSAFWFVSFVSVDSLSTCVAVFRGHCQTRRTCFFHERESSNPFVMAPNDAALLRRFFLVSFCSKNVDV